MRRTNGQYKEANSYRTILSVSIKRKMGLIRTRYRTKLATLLIALMTESRALKTLVEDKITNILITNGL